MIKDNYICLRNGNTTMNTSVRHNFLIRVSRDSMGFGTRREAMELPRSFIFALLWVFVVARSWQFIGLFDTNTRHPYDIDGGFRYIISILFISIIIKLLLS